MSHRATSLPGWPATGLFPFLAALVFCPGDVLHAQSSYVERIPILIEFLGPLDASGDGLTGKRPSWRLVADPSALQRLGLVREADKVTLEISAPPGSARIGSWSNRWKSDGGKDCSGWGPWKKCRQKWVFQDCPMNYEQAPLKNPVRLEIEFRAEGTDKPRKTITFQNGVASANYTAEGPRWLAFSGKFDREPLVCPAPGQTLVEPITKRYVMGDGQPEQWFTITVAVEQPALDD